MKKLIIFSIALLSSIAVIQSMEKKEGTLEYVKLISSDGKEFIFKTNVIELSKTIDHLIEDTREQLKRNEPISLSAITSSELSIIKKILDGITDNGEKDLRESKKRKGTQNLTIQLTEPDKQLIAHQLQNLNDQQCYELLFAVNYLDIDIIFETLLHLVADRISESNVLINAKGLFSRLVGRAVAEANGLMNNLRWQTTLSVTSGVNSVAIAANGTPIVVALQEGSIGIFDLAEEKYFSTAATHRARVLSLGIASNGKTAVAGLESGKACTFDVKTHAVTYSAGLGSIVTSVAITSDGKTAIAGLRNGAVYIWDAEAHKAKYTFVVDKDQGAAITSVALTSDGKTGIAGSENGMVYILNTELGKLKYKLVPQNPVGVAAVAINADGTLIISGLENGNACIWNAETGKINYELKVSNEGISSVAITSDSKTALFASLDKTVYVWNLETGELRYKLEGHTGAVTSVAITPDDSIAVSGSYDETIRTWSIAYDLPRDLTLNEIQILGWKLSKQPISQQAIKIYNQTKAQYPEIIKKLNL